MALAGDEYASASAMPAASRRIHGLVPKIVLQTAIFLIFWLLKRQYHQIGKEFQETIILRFTFVSKALWNPLSKRLGKSF